MSGENTLHISNRPKNLVFLLSCTFFQEFPAACSRIIVRAHAYLGQMKKPSPSNSPSVADFLIGKSVYTTDLFNHFVKTYRSLGTIEVLPAKTMIGIATPRKRIAYVTQLGKNFVHVVFPFKTPYRDNLCFQKIAQVPGDEQYNHHLRILDKSDINREVIDFMKLAYELGS